MMKIERPDNPHPLQPADRKKSPGPVGERFRDVLQEAVSTTPGISQPGNLQNLPPAGGLAGFVPHPGRKELVGRADQLLALLESLQKNLSGPAMPLKEAYDSMKAIEDRADELTPLMESLPEGDDFRDFLNRLVITASVEAIKFRRGDYL
jgi:hypothetical protein